MKTAYAIVLTILVCGCVIGGGENQPTEAHVVSNNPHLSACNNRSTVNERENCYVDTATQTNAPTLCEEVGTERLRNLCYHRIAVTLLDPSICVKIKDDDWRYTDCMTSTTR